MTDVDRVAVIAHEKAIGAALDAAFPGLPQCMTLEEAEDRVRAGVEAYLAATKLRGAVEALEQLATGRVTMGDESYGVGLGAAQYARQTLDRLGGQ